MAATSKTITLKGNSNNPEAQEHHIEFPGGSISVCRTSNNEYWAHIYVHEGESLDDTVRSKQGEIIERRDESNHIAVKIKTK